MNDHLLSLLLAVPAIGALVMLFIPRQWTTAIRNVSVGFMLVEFLLSLRLLPADILKPVDANFSSGQLLLCALLGAGAAAYVRWELGGRLLAFLGTTLLCYGALSGMQGGWFLGDYTTSAYIFNEDRVWVEGLGIHYKLGIDGISLWLVLLTTLLTPISLFVSWTSVSTKLKEYALAFLLLEVGMLGAFFSLDLFLFYIFWELMLVPMYLIIGIWGGKNRVYAAVKFFLYTMVGSLLMLVAILYLVGSYKELAGNYTFDLIELQRVVLPFSVQAWLFGAFALAFAIKVPMFPFHTWLPNAHVQAPTGGSVILAAVLLKLGIYGFLRFAMPLFPLASQYFGPTIAAIGVIGIIYGAYCAWVQRDLKKLVAYSSVSHMGFIALGLFAMTPQGISGSILQMINHGVSTGALFILVGVIYERRHTRDLDAFGGLAKIMPWYAVIFIIVTMSSIGLPGTNGFVGEFMILSGAFVSDGIIGLGANALPQTIFAATGVIFAAIYMLHAVLKLFWGPVQHKVNEGLEDLTRREAVALAPLLLLIFWIGVYPKTFLHEAEPSVNNFITEFQTKWTASTQNDTLRLLPQKEVPQKEGTAVAVKNAPLDGRTALNAKAAKAEVIR